MNTQRKIAHAGSAASAFQTTLRAGHIVTLGSAGGRLDVLHGRVWLTREGELDDHLVETGQSFSVPANGRALVEAWDDEDPALIAWRAGSLLDRASAYVRSALSRE